MHIDVAYGALRFDQEYGYITMSDEGDMEGYASVKIDKENARIFAEALLAFANEQSKETP
jgi:hypothetical protein